VPLTEEQILKALQSLGGLIQRVPVLLTYEGRPDGTSRPTWIIKKICREVEATHGIASLEATERSSTTQFVVVADGVPRQIFDTADQAISYAASFIYASDLRLAQAMKSLEAGHTAHWQYGFSSVTIHPTQSP
jgi:hypothetical protein